MSNTPPHKESFYQAKIIRWLKGQYPDAFVWKAQAGPYCRQGIPDICAIINGHFFGFEVKRPEVGRLSKIQCWPPFALRLTPARRRLRECLIPPV